MFFQMLPVFLAVIAFVGIDDRTFGYTFQQRRQVVALMGIGRSNVQFLDIALFVTLTARWRHRLANRAEKSRKSESRGFLRTRHRVCFS